MKRKMKVFAISITLCFSVLFSSCIGSFSLFSKLLTWNSNIDDKFVNELIFLLISPAYVVAGTVDILILNSIEFWTGENPVNEEQVKRMEGKDGSYTIETNSNGHIITKEDSGEVVYFHFDAQEKIWSIESDGETSVLLKVINEEEVIAYLHDGTGITIPLTYEGVQACKQAVMNNTYYANK